MFCDNSNECIRMEIVSYVNFTVLSFIGTDLFFLVVDDTVFLKLVF